MKNRKFIFSGIIIFLLVAGAFIYFVMQKTDTFLKDQQLAKLENKETPTPAITGNENGKSLRDFFASTETISCNYKNDAGKSSGKIQVAGSKLHGEFMTELAGISQTSNLVSDGKLVYIWVEGDKTGFKIPLTDIKAADPKNSSNKELDLDKKIDYTCEPWNVDQSVFNIPKEVTFTDLSLKLDTNTSGSESLKFQQCSACNGLPDPKAVVICKEAFGC